MKKIMLIAAMMVCSVLANAFEFDSIDLNAPYSKVVQEIAKRGYTYNHERNCLQGDCRGSVIYMSINYVDVKTVGMLGQLIVEVPMAGDPTESFKLVTNVLNVLYHQVEGAEGLVYALDPDGTTMAVTQKPGFFVLTYNTPYYADPSKKTEKKR